MKSCQARVNCCFGVGIIGEGRVRGGSSQVLRKAEELVKAAGAWDYEGRGVQDAAVRHPDGVCSTDEAPVRTIVIQRRA